MRLTGRKFLVTGGAGFLGSHLCEKLLDEGAGVRALDNLTSGRDENLRNIKDRAELINCDISSEDSLMKAIGDSDTIVHLAFPMALRQGTAETGAITAALAGLLNSINSALAKKALLIYISSVAVYGDGKYNPIDEGHPLEPVLLHGALKLAGENFCLTYAKSQSLRAVILRVADIYGPRNARLSVPIKFLLQAGRNEPVTVYGDGSDCRTYTFVDDFCEGVVLSAICPEANGGVFNLGGDECVSIRSLALEVRRITGSGSPLRFLDRPAAGRRLQIDSSKAKEVLGFKPSFDLSAGLAATFRWLQDNPQFY